jgi:hypothetical protein
MRLYQHCEFCMLVQTLAFMIHVWHDQYQFPRSSVLSSLLLLIQRYNLSFCPDTTSSPYLLYRSVEATVNRRRTLSHDCGSDT